MENEIIINTKIDTSGIDKGIDEIKTKLSELSKHTIQAGMDFQQSMENATTDVSGLLDNFFERYEGFWNDFSEGFVDGMSQAFNEAKESAKGAEDAIDSLTGRMDANITAIANTTANIEEYIKGLEGVGEQSKQNEKRASKLGGILSAIGSRLRGFGQKLTGPIKQAGAFVKRFLSIAGAIALFKKLTSSVKSAVSALEGWGTTTSYVISDYKKAMKDATNAMAAMIAPLIDTYLPKITALINRIAEGFNKIGMYVSAALGKQTYTKAVVGLNDYKDAVAKTGAAADKAAGSLASFDELTVIDTGGEQEQNPFVTEGIPEDIQDIKSLNDLLNSIDWDGIKEKAASMATTIAESINKVVGSIDWNLVGSTLAEGVNTAFTFLDTFITTTDWSAIGKAIGDTISGFFTTVDWTLIGKTVADGINGIFDLIEGIADSTDWVAVGKGIADGLSSLFQNIDWANIGESLSKMWNGIVTSLHTIITQTDWSAAGAGLATSIGEFLKGIDWGEMIRTVLDLIVAAFETATSFVETIDITGILNAIVEGFKSVDWGKVIPEIVSAAFELAGAVTGLGVKVLEWIVGLVAEIGKAISEAFSEWWNENALDEEGKFTIEGFLSGMAEALYDIGDWIYTNIFKPFIDGFKAAFGISSPSKVMAEMGGFIIDGLKEGIGDVWDQLGQKFTEFKDKIVGKFEEIKNNLTEKAQTIRDNVSERFTTLRTNVQERVGAIKDNLTSRFQEMSTNVAGKITTISGNVSEKFASIRSTIQSNLNTAATDVSTKFSTMSSTVTTKLSTMSSNITTKFSTMRSTVQTKLSTMSSDLSTKFSTMSTNVSTKLSTMTTTMSTKFQGIVTSASEKAGQIVSAFTGQDWSSIGTNITSGIQSGINSGWGWLSSTVSSVASSMLSTAKKALGISSPSKAFRDQVGAMIDQGLAIGIEDEAQVPLQAMNDIATSLTDTAIGALQGPTIASGSVLPTQIASSIAKSDIGTESEAISLNDLISMVRDIRNDQQDLLETLIQVVQNKNFTLTPNAATGRVISQAIKQYQGVTG